MGSNEDSVIASEPVAHKFGDEELSDVTFVVGGEEFKCHKMTLASRSTYFKAIFYSNFKEKDQDKVSIEADPVSFKWILELMYTGQFTDWATHLSCPNVLHKSDLSVTLWKKIFALLRLADQFDILKDTVYMLENYLILCGECTVHRYDCWTSAFKVLIAVKYDMDRYKKKHQATQAALWEVLEILKNFQPTFSIDVSGHLWLLNFAR